MAKALEPTELVSSIRKSAQALLAQYGEETV